MPLGIEQNSIAPALIAENGRALVNSIRMIGQQISSNLTQVQTRRDLGNMAQDMQGLNVQSEDFPIQLVQLASRHPLAVNDDRGQMAISVLGKAHSDWRRSIESANAFERQMKLQTMREGAYANRAAAAEEARSKRPVSVFGVGLVDPMSGDVLVPEGSRGGASNSPRTLSPGSILVDPQGNKIAENPKLPSEMTPYQKQVLSARERAEAIKQKAFKKNLLMSQDDDARAEFGRLEARLDRIQKQKLETTNAADRAFLDSTAQQIMEEAAKVKARRLEIQRAIEGIEAVPVEGSVSPPGSEEGLIPSGEVPAAVSPADDALIPVINPQGKSVRIRKAQLEAALQNGYKQR